MKIDLSEFLPKKKGVFDDLLGASPEPTPLPPQEVLSPPELVTLHWLHQTCICGTTYSAQEHQPTIRHTMSRRAGFGLRSIGKVYIPFLAGQNISDIPQEISVREEKIFYCPKCVDNHRTADMFPSPSPNYVDKWMDMHKTSRQAEIEATLKSMNSRELEFGDLLGFQTTNLDLQSVAQQVCDPEKDA